MVLKEQKVSVRGYRQGAVVVLELTGPLVADSLGLIEQAIEQHVGGAVPRLVLDLGAVTVVDSAGLEWLLDTQEGMRQRGGDLKLARPQELFSEVLRITGLDSTFETYESVPQAVGSYAL